ncbi:MAG: hypothetical protein ABI461_02955 [Polyangiaceae bacterium]
MRHLLFISLTATLASLALGGVVLASPTDAPAPTRVVLMPAPPPPVAISADGGVPAAPAAPPWIVSKTPADPPPIISKSQWVYDLRWDKGSVYLLGVHPLELPAPQATPRVMGRFAVELYSGSTLVERARFDFPMLGAGEGLAPADAGTRRTQEDLNRVTFSENKLVSRIGVIFPATRKGNRLDLVDRATGVRLVLPWPPAENPPKNAVPGNPPANLKDAG